MDKAFFNYLDMNKIQLRNNREIDTFISYEERMLRKVYIEHDELLVKGLWKLYDTTLFVALDTMSTKELVKQYVFITKAKIKILPFQDEWIIKFQQKINQVL